MCAHYGLSGNAPVSAWAAELQRAHRPGRRSGDGSAAGTAIRAGRSVSMTRHQPGWPVERSVAARGEGGGGLTAGACEDHR